MITFKVLTEIPNPFEECEPSTWYAIEGVDGYSEMYINSRKTAMFFSSRSRPSKHYLMRKDGRSPYKNTPLIPDSIVAKIRVKRKLYSWEL